MMIAFLSPRVPENYLNRAEIIHKLFVMDMLNVMSSASLKLFRRAA